MAFMFLSGCAFFNTFYHARKAYNNAVDAIEHSAGQTPSPLIINDVPPDRFSQEFKTVPADAKQFLDVVIEKATKVVVLYPKSGWAEDATLLLGKAHYMRANTNDLYDAKNRLEVFMTRYPGSKKTDEAKLWYGKTLLKLNQIDDAENNFRQVVESAENSQTKSEALILLGDIAMDDEDFTAASEYYVKASEIAGDKKLKKPALYKAYYTHFHVNNYTKAIGYLNVLSNMDLDFNEKFDVFFMKARTMKLAGQYNEAIDVLDRFIGNQRYKNYFVKAEFEIADVLRLAGKNTKAVKQFNYVIETYKNQVFTGDSYYLMGLIYDTPVLARTEKFFADPELAKKYYFLVKTKYSNSTFAASASERFDYLTKMSILKGSIQADQVLLQAIENKIQDNNFVVSLESYFPSMDSLPPPVPDLGDSTAGSSLFDKTKEEVISEIATVEISNTELTEKLEQVKMELLDIGQLKDQQTLLFKKDQTVDMLAADHVLLADYFYFNLSDYDSAGIYYQYVIDHFKSSPNLEFALYGQARVQQKKNHPEYRSFYEYAYNVFPNGRLADIGRKLLGLKEIISDSVTIYFQLAENHLLQKQNYTKALQYYTRVALKDSADRRLQALYAMGLLFEKKMDNPAEAFRTYNTLLFAGPNSEYAKKVKPKVDEYAKENGITKDSLLYWIHRDILKIVIMEEKKDTVKNEARPPAPVIDSTRSRIPQEFIRLDDDDAVSDSTQMNKSKKTGKKKSSIKAGDIKGKENDERIKDE